MSLLRNYFSTLFRSFRRDLFYSLLNLTGLAAGLAASFLIFVYVKDELSFDRHFKDHERVYRLESLFTIKGKEDYFAVTQVPLAPTLKDEFPEIEDYARIFQAGPVIFKKDNELMQEDSVWYADSTHFNLLSSEFIYGDPDKALAEPKTMVLSASLSKKYFGESNPVGEVMETNDGQTFRITGVFYDLPGNSHIRYNALLSAMTIAENIGVDRFNDRSAGSFWNVNVMSFIKLKPGASMQSIIDKFQPFYDKYMKEIGEQIQASFVLRASPLAEMHFKASELGYDQPAGNRSYNYVLSLVGLFILIIAAINYMNLSTARATRRSKEVGLRKVVGANRGLLIRQFLTESLFLSLMAMVLAIVLIILLLPLFNELTGKGFGLTFLIQPENMIAMVLITLLTAVGSGLYPALYLSAFNPVHTLKGRGNGQGKGSGFRKGLVVVQFAISAALITGSLVVGRQLKHMQSRDTGFIKENLIVLTVRDSTIQKNIEAFKQELLNNPDIEAVASSGGAPGLNMGKVVMRMENNEGGLDERAVNFYSIDYDYIPTMGIRIAEGRNYSREMGSDKNKAFVINQAAVKECGWGESGLGKRWQFAINLDGSANYDGEVIGVVSDFNYASLRNPVQPIMLFLDSTSRRFGLLNIRIRPGTETKSLDYIKSVRDEFKPYYPFDYFFLEERLSEQYKAEATIHHIVQIFTLLTLLIAVLGLLGLSAFMTQQKTREIGIRKVLGSSPEQIMLLFLKEFMRWVLLANAIGLPVAWYFMNGWLQDFYYRTNIGAGIFIVTVLGSLLIATATVIWQVLRASGLQPAESLKYE